MMCHDVSAKSRNARIDKKMAAWVSTDFNASMTTLSAYTTRLLWMPANI